MFTMGVIISDLGELKIGIFSGYFYVDVDGTWNGSTFTMKVMDLMPHFFYFDTFKLENAGTTCSTIGGWASTFGIPNGQDFLFSLNLVFFCYILINERMQHIHWMDIEQKPRMPQRRYRLTV